MRKNLQPSWFDDKKCLQENERNVFSSFQLYARVYGRYPPDSSLNCRHIALNKVLHTWRVGSALGSNPVAYPDLQIKGGGEGRGGHPDVEIRGRGQSQKSFFFRPFGPQFGLKIRGKGPPGPLSWIRHCNPLTLLFTTSVCLPLTNSTPFTYLQKDTVSPLLAVTGPSFRVNRWFSQWRHQIVKSK